MPFRNAVRYDPVMSKITPEIQPPNDMPTDRRPDHNGDAGCGFFRRHRLSDNDGIARHEATLEQAEQAETT